uniref:Uncharacterized protein n=1 Tax=Clastoptera arizonana TaxID=38151 RepID=A0A1B6C5E6_9HEMI
MVLLTLMFQYDIDQSTFSPPTEDDSFFHIRYPKPAPGPKQIRNENPENVYRSVNEVLENHTLPCQEFIPAAKTTPHELGMKKPIDPPLGVIKSAGTDDGFKGIGAACGQSVVAVAHQMINSGKLSVRRPPMISEDDEFATPPPTHMLARRRGSKSLPSSPQTSPKTLRKNPYFTNVMLGSTGNLMEANKNKGKQSWLLSYMRESQSLRGSLDNLKIDEQPSAVNLAEITHQEGIVTVAPEAIKPKNPRIRAKPSQLREMNFWSPTSM